MVKFSAQFLLTISAEGSADDIQEVKDTLRKVAEGSPIQEKEAEILSNLRDSVMTAKEKVVPAEGPPV